MLPSSPIPLLPSSFSDTSRIDRSALIESLRSDILHLQKMSGTQNTMLDAALGPIRFAFPHQSFPQAAVHEFLSPSAEVAAATTGFLTGLLTNLMATNGVVLWISAARKLFTPALKNFGAEPQHFIFIDLQKEREVLWAVDEALKCPAVAAVVAEVREMDFVTSRRLQLAVERSGTTGFILRSGIRNLNATAATARWKISPLPSQPIDDLPGIGYPKWRVSLLKVRNGKPGVWDLQWRDGRLILLEPEVSVLLPQQKMAG